MLEPTPYWWLDRNLIPCELQLFQKFCNGLLFVDRRSSDQYIRIDASRTPAAALSKSVIIMGRVAAPETGIIKFVPYFPIPLSDLCGAIARFQVRGKSRDQAFPRAIVVGRCAGSVRLQTLGHEIEFHDRLQTARENRIVNLVDAREIPVRIASYFYGIGIVAMNENPVAPDKFESGLADPDSGRVSPRRF
jgi:hypothetical protein